MLQRVLPGTGHVARRVGRRQLSVELASSRWALSEENRLRYRPPYPRLMRKPNPFRYFTTSPEIIRLAVMMYIRFPLSLRNVEDLLHERGIDISHGTVRFWWNRFGPMFAAEIRQRRVQRMRSFTHWKWHLDEVFVKINGETRNLWRAVDHEGEVLEAFVSRRRDRKSAMKFLRKLLKRLGPTKAIVTDQVRPYGAAMRDLGECGPAANRSTHEQQG